MRINLNNRVVFQARHNGPNEKSIESMLDQMGIASLDQLISEAIPKSIRSEKKLDLPEALNEYQYLDRIKVIAQKNKIFHNYIGQGYYGTILPSVIQRNILETPGWYTAYTSYQAEISQGRLEALMNFQTMVSDLTSMELSNASLLDEATAAAEAMLMLFKMRSKERKSSLTFLVDKHIYPQTLSVLNTRALPFNINIKVVDIWQEDFSSASIFGLFIQNPDNKGNVIDYSQRIQEAQQQGILSVCASDLFSLTLLTPPGEWGVDVVVGSAQRFGTPMGFGGPHAAFFATKDAYKRFVPGRIIGASMDKNGNTAYRMALQTREQHIKRERATSNICTSQVLLAIISSMYAVYHGPNGLKDIALRIHGLAKVTQEALKKLGFINENKLFFDTLHIKLSDSALLKLKEIIKTESINLRLFEDAVGISFDESHLLEDAQRIADVFYKLKSIPSRPLEEDYDFSLPKKLNRTSTFLTHLVFHNYHTEHELLRYMKRLENKDLSLVHSMISLGSCTMKLNATTQMIPITWPEFGRIHPFAPKEQTEGFQQIIQELGSWLKEITGFEGISFQPNSGAQGEYAGLLCIKSYLMNKKETARTIVLIPSSAHGTNPASAIMAGLKVVIIKCDADGNIDIEDLKQKADQYEKELAMLMITYPSTHGVFEENIIEMCNIIHDKGGQVYMDGANMNAQVGLTSPALIGVDVCHLNLHKTFCIPHGGGGPGMGPIAVAKHLIPFLPGHYTSGNKTNVVSSTPYSSASILPISHAYIAMMGAEGLENATKIAILNANYIAHRLKDFYNVLYTNKKGRNAHELIIDCRGFKSVGIEIEDIGKRLIDYGYHAPTISFPVPGTMMIEPTESETKEEMDRFCDALIGIREEIQAVIEQKIHLEESPLKNAPHSYATLVADKWHHVYSREKAAFPLPYVRKNKFWPMLDRIDNVYGDRHLVCSCIPVQEYEEEHLNA